MQNKVVTLKEDLHKAPDVYHNIYLMQCLKLTYVNYMEVALLFSNVNFQRATSHRVFSCSRRVAYCMPSKRWTILQFDNLAE